jgi:predicted membrane chloride channel (bestrophin family)
MSELYLREESDQIKLYPLQQGKDFVIGSNKNCDLQVFNVPQFYGIIEVGGRGEQESVAKIHIATSDEYQGIFISNTEPKKWVEISKTDHYVLQNNDRLRFGKTGETYVLVQEGGSPLCSRAAEASGAETVDGGGNSRKYSCDTNAHTFDIDSNGNGNDDAYNAVLSTEEQVDDKLIEFENVRVTIEKFSWFIGFKLLFLYNYTVLQHVAEEPLYPITLLLYILTRILVIFDVIGSDTKYLEPAGTISTVLSFLFVFYVSNAYSVYYGSYNASMTVHGSVQNIAMCVRSELNRPAALKVLRLLNAAHFTAYVGLSPKDYKVDNFLVPSCNKYHLLTNEELQFLMTLDVEHTGGHGFKSIVAWVSDILHAEAKHGRLDRFEFKLILELLHKFRGNLGQLYDNKDFSVPFIYVHFVYLCTALYLPLSAYALGRAGRGRRSAGILQYELFSFVALFFKCIFFLGLYRLSRSFQNPYGLEPACFSVKAICEDTYHASFRILNVLNPSSTTVSSEVEYKMHSQRPKLGTGRFVDDEYRMGQGVKNMIVKKDIKSDDLPRPKVL